MKNNFNLIIAAVLMMGFLMFWESFVMSRYNTQPKPAPASVAHEPMSEAEFQALKSAGNASGNTSSKSASAPKEETLTVLETPDTKVSLLSKGARVASWQIKERDHWIELVVPEKKRVVSPLETLPEVNFSTKKISATDAIFTATLSNGVVLTKELRLLSEPPFHSVSITATNPSKLQATIDLSMPLGNGIDKHEVGTPYDSKLEQANAAEMRAVGFTTQVKSWKPGLIFGRTVDLVDPDHFTWTGIDNNHFLMAALAPANESISPVKVIADRIHPPMIALALSAELKPGESLHKVYPLYVGPKDYTVLKTLGHNLVDSVNFGFFGVIAKILLQALKFFDRLTGNYGWAIVVLTFLIQLVAFPLTKKNLEHSARMRELQPQIKRLQEQYKSDPKRLQVETFNFYKKNGMKFMGMEGCFPMLVQLPVFYAFYSTLRVAYELRGAPWIFWIKDLAAYDPRYVLPIIMGIGMFLQQKMTAVAADPAQARMMLFMPIIFVFMFFKLPAGLVLYWCVNSLTTIVLMTFLGHHKKKTPQTAS